MNEQQETKKQIQMAVDLLFWYPFYFLGIAAVASVMVSCVIPVSDHSYLVIAGGAIGWNGDGAAEFMIKQGFSKLIWWPGDAVVGTLPPAWYFPVAIWFAARVAMLLWNAVLAEQRQKKAKLASRDE